MSRSGYSDDYDDQWGLIRWRGAVNSAIKGKRGQAFLRELAAAMDAMPDKRLVPDKLQTDGDFCALGVVGQARGIDLDKIDTEDWEQLAREFGISEALAREIMYENDDTFTDELSAWIEVCGPMRTRYPHFERHHRYEYRPNPRAGEARWERMRAWVDRHIVAAKEGSA